MQRNRNSSEILAIFGAIGAIALGACGGGGGGGVDAAPRPDAGPVSYAADIRPIFQGKCISCHHPTSGIDVDLENPFDPEHGIINRANTWVPNGSKETLIVEPGNLENSFLLKKIEETNLDDHVDGSPMPMRIARVTAGELEDIKQWIRDGAQNDAFFAENVAPVFGTELTLRSASGKCTWCHYPGSPTGLSVLDPFDPEEGMVDVDSSLVLGKIVAPGDVEGSFLIEKLEQMQPRAGNAMPYHPPRLTADEIEAVRAWVAQGAQNN